MKFTRTKLIIIIALAALIIGCKSDDERISGNDLRFLASSYETADFFHGEGFFTNFENQMTFQGNTLTKWDSGWQNFHMRINLETSNSLITRYDRLDIDRGDTSIHDSEIIYDENGRVISIDNYYEDHISGYMIDRYFLFSYSGNNLIVIEENSGDQWTLVFDGMGRVIRFDDGNKNYEYSYENGNLKTTRMNGFIIRIFEHDDSRNPFYSEDYLNIELVRFLVLMLTNYDRPSLYRGVFGNVNNITSMQNSNNCSGCGDDNGFSYEYNSDNYPVRKVPLSSSDLALIYTYE